MNCRGNVLGHHAVWKCEVICMLTFGKHLTIFISGARFSAL